MTTAVIVQARMGSTRLPGKIARPILGKPMLAHEIERLVLSKKADVILVATTDKPEDDLTENIARERGFACYRGSEADVLDRYYEAAKSIQADVIVRVTGDCPLHDPDVLDLVIERFGSENVDYAKTPANYPEGLDTEIFSFPVLEAAWKEARLPSEREHVTPFIRNHPERFKLDSEWSHGDLDHSSYHWSVDTEADFIFVSAVFAHFANQQRFRTSDVLVFLAEHPEIVELNKGGTGYEGLEKSLQEDEEWKKNHA